MENTSFPNLQEFETKILDITGDNLEIITGHEFQLSLKDITPSAEVDPDTLAGYPVRADVRFADDNYGDWTLFLPEQLAAFLVATMVGEEPGEEFNPDEDVEPAEELLAQILSPYLSELSSMEGRQIDTESLKVQYSEDQPQLAAESLLISNQVIIDSETELMFFKLVPEAFAGKLTAEAEGEDNDTAETVEQEAAQTPDEPVEMAGAEFQPFQSGEKSGNGANIELLMDLEMPITIELGRTRMTIKKILELGQGSIIELDKLSGDPVDVFINDRKFAEGEVVVVDENFGVRITEIVSPVEKIKSLQ